MFYNCTSLVGGEETAYDSSHTGASYGKIDGGTSDPGYLTGVSISYDVVGINKTVTPTVKLQDIFANYTITGYEIVSGSQYLKIHASTGAVTGVANGEAVVKMTAKSADGKVITTQKTVYVGTTTYAVYSADDQSLTFYKTSDTIKKGQTYNGKTVTAVYAGIETTQYFYDMFTGNVTTPWYADGTNANIQKVVFADEIKPSSLVGWFSGFENLTSIDLTKLDTSNVTSMAGLFEDCESLETITFGDKWTTAQVMDMQSMFYGCSSLASIDVTKIDTSNVRDMNHMFSRCTSLTSLDLSGWDVSNVFNMSGLFSYCKGLTELDLVSWNWDVSAVESMEGMFQYCTGLTSITFDWRWNTSKVKDMDYLFCGCNALTSVDFAGIDTSNVESISEMFGSCLAMTSLDLNGIDVSNVRVMDYLFYNCTALTTLDISTWNTAKVESMYGMFYGCSKLVTVYVSDSWSTENVTSSGSMFYKCASIVGGEGTIYDANYRDATYARIDGGVSAPGYLTDVADKP